MDRYTVFILGFLLLYFGCTSNTTEVGATGDDMANEAEMDLTTNTAEVEVDLTSNTDDEVKIDSVVMAFITKVKNNDKASIAKTARFPISREYPLPDLKFDVDFIASYDDIFDEELRNEIISSDVSKDWDQVGWRGIMLNHGTIWLDMDGALLSVVYHSETENKRKEEIIEKDRASIHESLRDFKRPVSIMETEKFRIRIDEMEDLYRYASWEKENEQSEKPDLIIEGGDLVMDGSGGNHYYIFKNGDYIYQCYVIVLGASESPLGVLTVTKGDEEILNNDIIKIER